MAYGYYIVSNPDLKSETSTNYEIGINGDYDKFKFDQTVSGAILITVLMDMKLFLTPVLFMTREMMV